MYPRWTCQSLPLTYSSKNYTENYISIWHPAWAHKGMFSVILPQAWGPKLDSWADYNSFDTTSCPSGSNKGHENFHVAIMLLILNHLLTACELIEGKSDPLFGIDNHDYGDSASNSLSDKKSLSGTAPDITFSQSSDEKQEQKLASGICQHVASTSSPDIIWAMSDSRSSICLGRYSELSLWPFTLIISGCLWLTAFLGSGAWI